MPLHRLTRITVGVPNVAETCSYYDEFGLTPAGEGSFSTSDGGEQLQVVESPRRGLVELGVGVDDSDDVARIAAALESAGHDVAVDGSERLVTVEPATGTRVVVSVAQRISATEREPLSTNGPGWVDRRDKRAPSIQDDYNDGEDAKPRKLGHVVLGTPDEEAVRAFFTELIGFKVSDEIAGIGAFLRCSTDHHNLLVQSAPVVYLHHTSWQVADVDEIGRSASRMLKADPSRHVWGLGRHFVGSNFFWYLRDPAGNFSEYYCDLDVIIDDEMWKPEVWSGVKSLYAWGPDVPPSFIAPDDLAELMAGR